MANRETLFMSKEHILLYKRAEILTVIIRVIIIVCILWSGTHIIVCVLWSGTRIIVVEQRKQIIAGTVLSAFQWFTWRYSGYWLNIM